MDSLQRRRNVQCNRQEVQPSESALYGSRQICLPITREQYDDIWSDAGRVRIGGVAFTLRPSFAMTYFIGTTQDMRKPLLLLAHGFLKVRDRCNKEHELHKRDATGRATKSID